MFDRDKDKKNKLNSEKGLGKLNADKIKGLTPQETEALGAARAADLRERDKRLAEDKENERRKEEKNKRIRKYLGIAAIILFILLLLARCSQLPVPESIKEVIDNIGFENTIDNDKIKPNEQIENYDGRYSMLTISMNKVPVFKNGLSEGNLNITNDEQNVYAQYVEIYVDDNEGNPDPEQKIYTSGLIGVGQTLPTDTLDLNLPAGTYKCTAYFNAVNLSEDETTGQTVQTYAGKGAAKIEITVLETVAE